MRSFDFRPCAVLESVPDASCKSFGQLVYQCNTYVGLLEFGTFRDGDLCISMYIHILHIHIYSIDRIRKSCVIL